MEGLQSVIETKPPRPVMPKIKEHYTIRCLFIFRLSKNVNKTNGVALSSNTLKELYVPEMGIYGVRNTRIRPGIPDESKFNLAYHQDKFRLVVPTILTVSCAMDFSRYPFDSHVCDLLVGDHYFGAKTISYSLNSYWFFGQNFTSSSLDSGIFMVSTKRGLPFETFARGLGSETVRYSENKTDQSAALSYTGVR